MNTKKVFSLRWIGYFLPMLFLLLSFSLKAQTVDNVEISDEASVAEGGTVSFTVTYTNCVGCNTFNLNVAINDAEYAASTTLVLDGTGTQTLDITVGDDNVVEATETMTVTLSNGTATINSAISLSDDVDVTDNDNAFVNVSPGFNDEGMAISIDVTMSNPSDVVTTVDFSTADNGSAVAGTDYTANTGQTITFPANDNTTQTIMINTSDDDIVELSETFDVIIGSLNNNSRPGVTIVTGSAAAQITNDDQATISIDDVTLDEGDAGSQLYTFTATLTGDVDVTVSVDYDTQDGTATTADADYDANTGNSITFAGNDGEQETMAITVNGDNFEEATQTFSVVLSSIDATGRDVIFVGNPGTLSGTGTITNDDDALVSVAKTSGTDLTEGTADQVEFTATLSEPAVGAVTVDFDYTGTTGLESDVVSSAGTFTFADTETTATITFDDFDDSLDEASPESLTYQLSNVSGNGKDVAFAIDGGNDEGSFDVIDDDPAPTVTLSAGAATIAENGGSTTITATLNAVSAQEVTVPLVVSGTSEAGDYTLATEIVIAANDADGAESITLTSVDDAIDDDAETIIIDIDGTPTNGIEGSPNQVTVTIIDDDSAPTVTINPGIADEGDALTMTVTLSNPSGADLTLNFGATDGTAVVDTDLDGTIASLVFTENEMAPVINGGSNILSKDITINTTADTIDEPQEDFTVAITGFSPTGGISSSDTGLGQINDDAADTPPTVTVADQSASEGGTLTFTVTLSNASSNDVVLDFTTTDGTAITTGTVGDGESDFGAPSLSSHTFPAATQATGTLTQTVTISLTEDVVHEDGNTTTAGIDNETFTFNVAANAANTASLGAISGATGTIIENDAAPGVTITAGTLVAEGSSQAFTAALSHKSNKEIIIDLQANTGGANAAQAGEFTIGATRLTFDALSTSHNEANVQVALAADNIDEGTDDAAGSETYLVTATNSGGATNGTTISINTVAGNIIDDDVAPIISITGETDDEQNDIDFTFAITNGQLSDEDIVITTVSAVGAGDAETSDFATGAQASVTFQNADAGGTGASQMVAVATADDTIDEVGTSELETFELTGTASSGTFSFANNVATGTIQDVDDAPVLVITDPSVTETNSGTATATFGLSLQASGATSTTNATTSSDDIILDFSTSAGTATADDDYTSTPNSITETISAGATTTTSVTVDVSGDTDFESAGVSETFELVAAVNASSVGQADVTDTGVASIVNDDPAPTVTISDETEEEGEQLTFTVSLDQASDATITIEVSTANGTAVAETTVTGSNDYVAISDQVVTFNPGITSQTVTVDTNEDAIYEGDEIAPASETFTLEVTDVGIGAQGLGNSGTGSIQHDDAPPSVVLAVSSNGIIEDSETATVQAILIGNTSIFDVDVEVTATTSVAIEGTDFSIDDTYPTFSLTAASGATLSNQVTITPIADIIYEDEFTETVTFAITGVTGGNESGTQEEIIEIIDSESAPVVNISSETEEEGTDLVFTVELGTLMSDDIVSANDITIDVQTNGGSAIEDTDYTGKTETITIPAGSHRGTFTVDGAGTVDAVYEDVNGDENFTVSGVLATSPASDGGIDAGGVVTGTGTIEDEDSEPVVTLSVDTNAIDENAGTAIVTATLTGATTSEEDVTIDWTFTGTAADPADYSHNATSDQTVISAGTSVGTFTITSSDDLIYENPDETIILNAAVTNGTESGGDITETVTITDDEPAPIVSIALGSNSIDEDGNTTVTANIDNGVTNANDMVVSLSYAAASGNTTADMTHTDLGTTTASVTILANATSSNAGTVGGNTNDNDEPDEDFDITVTSVTNGGTNPAGIDATLTLVDNDNAPSVTLTLDNATITENGAPSSTDISAIADVTSELPITVNLLIEDADDASGDTADNEDYTIVPTIAIAAGSQSNTTNITADSDGIYEPEAPETLGISVTSLVNGTDGLSDLTLNIDEAGSAPLISISDATTVTEGDAVVYTVSFNDQGTGTEVSEDVDVTFSIGGSTSANLIQGDDYTEVVTSQTVTITAGTTNNTLLINTIDDALWEDSETLDVDVVGGTSANDTYLANPGNGLGIIDDNDIEPTIALGTNVTINEDDSPHTVTATLSAAAGKDIDVSFGLSGTAINPDDYSNTAPPTVMTTTAGVTALSTSFDIAIVDDNLDEDDETVIVDLSSTTVSVTDAQQTVTITDDADDLPPTVTVTVSPTAMSATEGSQYTVTATLSAPVTSGKDVSVNFVYNGGSEAGASDYDFAVPTITVTAGMTVGTGVIDFTDDTDWEGGAGTTETLIFDVNVSTAVGDLEEDAGALVGSQLNLEIEDNEVTPAVFMNPSVFVVNEDAGTSTITFELVDPANSSVLFSNTVQDVIIPLSISGDATDTDDYNITGTNWDQGNQEVTIPVNETSTTITFTSVDDNTYEGGNETAIFDVTTPNGAVIFNGVQNKVLTITESDDEPVYTIEDVSVAEDAGSLTLTVTSTPASDEDVIIDVVLNDDTAHSVGIGVGEPDYTSATIQVTVLAGSATTTADVPLTDDNEYEATESFDVEMIYAGANTYSGVLDFSDTAVGTITNDDPLPTVTLSNIGSGTIAEAAGSTTIRAELDELSTEDVTVTLEVAGTAEHTVNSDVYDDYSYSSLTIVIASGASSNTTDFTAIQDIYDEGASETIIVSIASVNMGIDGSSAETITITDDDNAPNVNISDAGNDETGSITFDVSLAGGTVSDEDMTVNVSTDITGTGSGNAISGTDFTALVSQPVVISARTMSSTTDVSLVDDTIDEVNETFTLNVTSVITTVGVGSTNTGTGTISDDDINDDTPEVNMSVLTLSALEDDGTNNGSVDVFMTLSNPSSEDIIVNVIALDDTAVEGTDYSYGGAAIVVPALSTSLSTTVTLLEDNIDEFNEIFEIGFISSTGGINGTGASLGADVPTVVTITDNDDAPTLSFDAPDVSALEATGMLSFPFTLSNPSSGNVTIDFSAASSSTIDDPTELGHATWDDDFTAAVSSVVVSAGSLTGTAVVTVLDDATDEFNEELTISVDGSSVDANGPNGLLSDTGSDTGVILDDDAEPAVLMSVLDDELDEAVPQSTDVVFTLLSDTEKDVTVDVVFNNGIAAAPGVADLTDDYTVTGSSVTITAGDTQSTLTIASIDETPSLDEIEETIFVEIDAVINGTESGGIQDETVRIIDGDLPPVAKITSAATIVEGSGGVTTDGTVTITLHDPVTDAVTASSKDIQVTIQDLGNTAIEGTDVLSDDFTINNLVVDITAGDQTGTTTITTIADDFDELDEDAEMSIASGVNEGTDVITSDVTIDATSAVLTITDDDNPPVVSISIDGNVTTTDESAAANIVYRVTVASRSNLDITVDATYDGGTATHPDDETLNGDPRDFDFSTSEISQFSFTAAEMASGTLEKTVALDINNDNVYEVVSESISIDLSNGVNALLTGTTNATTNITNDDALPVITVSQTVFTIDEDENTPTERIFANMDRYSQLDVQIDFTISGDAVDEASAPGTGDYSQDGTQIVIASGNLSGTDDIEITVIDDDIDENEETVTYTVSNVTNGNTGIVGNSYDVDIEDNELGPDVVLTVDSSVPLNGEGDYAIFEEDGTALLIVTLVDPITGAEITSGLDVTITLDEGALTDAAIDDDFELPDAGDGANTIIIPAGGTTGSITLVSISDTEEEGDEQAIIAVANVVNGQPRTGQSEVGIVLIEDNVAPSGFTLEFIDPIVTSLNEESISFKILGGEEDAIGHFWFKDSNGTIIPSTPGTTTIIDPDSQTIADRDLSSLADGTIEVYMTLTDDYGNVSEAATASIEKIGDGQVFPEGFSPNGDGNNDTWELPGIEAHPDNLVIIFNRYGSIVWQATGYNNTDVAFAGIANAKGVNSSASLPDGSYFYVATYGSPQQVEKGFIVIRR